MMEVPPERLTHRSCQCGECQKCQKRTYDRKRYLANKEAKLAQNRDYALKNREKVRSANRAWKRRNPDKVRAENSSPAARERGRRYYLAHREEQLLARAERHRRDPGRTYRQHREWIARNPEAWRKIRLRYKMRRRNAALDAEAEQYADILHGDICSYCGKAANSLDHIEPLSGGGGIGWDNLTGACLSCNASKNARPLLQFLLARAA